MKSFKKYISAFIFYFLFTAFCLSATASAQKNYHNIDETGAEETSPEKAKSYTVTSIQRCYDLLSREDVLDIQQNYIKPYKECQLRAAIALKKKQKEKIKADAKNNDSPKAQHGFYRVQKKRAPPPEEPETTDNKPSP